MKDKSKNNLIVIRTIIIVIILSFILNIIIATIILHSFNRDRSESAEWNISPISYEIAKNDVELAAWLDECNKFEKGVYVLRNKQYNDGQYITNIYIYRTDNNYARVGSGFSVNFLKKETLSIIYGDVTDDDPEASDILSVKANSKNGYIDLTIMRDNAKETFLLKDIGIEE
ncbi:hypothetical protein [Konateibacter massiliensis]|uniref:hypothetical protein n=1 Tax=Konateibacter massiliensis TaxID=2002841 RepID=UPI000C148A16|nr:hypothetical protein [Konateibacter massiliensis]